MTTQPDITDFICSTLALACNRDADSLTPDTSLYDINVDSLTMVAVLAQAEAVYEIELSPDDTLALLEALSVSDLIDRLTGIIARQ